MSQEDEFGFDPTDEELIEMGITPEKPVLYLARWTNAPQMPIRSERIKGNGLHLNASQLQEAQRQLQMGEMSTSLFGMNIFVRKVAEGGTHMQSFLEFTVQPRISMNIDPSNGKIVLEADALSFQPTMRGKPRIFPPADLEGTLSYTTPSDPENPVSLFALIHLDRDIDEQKLILVDPRTQQDVTTLPSALTSLSYTPQAISHFGKRLPITQSI